MEKSFLYQDSNVRVITDDEEQSWFAGIDVCNILGYADSHQKIKSLDEDEYRLDRITDGQGRQKETLTVNEFGLYSLILSSTKPEAKVFKRWITHEVLPVIRKTGKYTSGEERDREESIQLLVAEIEKLIKDRDDLREKANKKTKDIDLKNTELMQLLKSDFRQKKIQFPE